MYVPGSQPQCVMTLETWKPRLLRTVATVGEVPPFLRPVLGPPYTLLFLAQKSPLLGNIAHLGQMICVIQMIYSHFVI